MLNEANISRPRPRPKLRGWGRSYEADARTMRSRPRPKTLWKKCHIMINNIWFKIIAGKINKITEFYTIFARKMPDYIIRQQDQGQAQPKTSRPRLKLWGRGQNFGLEDLTSLVNGNSFSVFSSFVFLVPFGDYMDISFDHTSWTLAFFLFCSFLYIFVFFSLCASSSWTHPCLTPMQIL